ncbi:hypothetical protein QBC39DRAFT_335115 [Podospora conica]|nr:hypothetical protein QBC39DRAFT_335115 [Schizothecium conicum]
MNCSCRTAALRIFVSNIAHIYVPPIIAAARLASRNPTSNPLRNLRSLERCAALPISASRSLHTTPYRSNKVEAVIGDMRIKEDKITFDNSHEFTLSNEAPRKPRKPSASADASADKRPGKPGTRPGRPGGKPGWKPGRPGGKPGQTGVKPGWKADGKPGWKPGRPGGKPGQPGGKPGWKAGAKPGWKPGKPDGKPGQPDARDKAKPEEVDNEFHKPSLHQLRILEQEEAGKISSRTDWKTQKEALKEKFPEGWQPRKRLSPDALAGIRALHAEFPDIYTTEELANKFEVSPENIRRILRSKWEPSADEEIERQERWFNRGKKVWSRWAELGKKPPRKWRAEGIVRDPIWNEKRGEGDKKSAGRKAREAHQKLSESFM